MLAFPLMLVPAAEKAGIKVPEDIENYEPADFPYFTVFCNMQLGRSMPVPYAHWENAKIIASIPEDKIKKVLAGDILAMGFY